MKRRQFLRTTAGYSVFLVMPGIWSCNSRAGNKQSFDFQTLQVEGQLAPVSRVTPEDNNFVQTYFDVTPFSPSGRFLAVSKVPFQDHLPTLGDVAEVCVIDLKEQAIQTVFTTRTWGFQTGTNVQWGGSDRYIYTNDLIDGKAVIIRVDLENGDTRAYSRSMYNVSRDGMYGIGFPLELLNVTQQGYGMPSAEVHNPPSLSVEASETEGVWRTHLESGKSTLLYSVADVASHVPEPMPRPGGTFYFWHSKYNRQGTRIMQVLRCIFPGFDGGSDRNAMVFTLSADGGDVQFTDHDPVWRYPLGGHPNWHPDGVHIIRNMKPDGKTTRICQFRYDGSDFRVLSESFQGKGHPSIEPGGRYVITDHRVFHPDGSATTSLVLLDVQLDRTERICSVPTFNSGHLEGAIRALRVDGHPCWSRDYKKVSLQGTYKGKRQLYVVDMSEWIS